MSVKGVIAVLGILVVGSCISTMPDISSSTGKDLVGTVSTKLGVGGAYATGGGVFATCGVTASGFAQLKAGMSYSDAVAVLGCPGQEMSRVELVGMTTVMYGWSGQNPIANMNAMFQNDALISKAQLGLR